MLRRDVWSTVEPHCDETQHSRKGQELGTLAAEPEEYQKTFGLDLDSF